MKPVKPVVWALLGVFSVYLAIAAASAYEEGSNIFVWMGRFSEVLKRPSLLRWTPYTVKCIIVVLLLCAFAVLLYRSDREKRRPGGEYGTAKWEAAETMNQKYADKDGPNVILTQHVSIGMDGYNPFRYIREEPDVLKLMDNLVKNTTPPKGASNDPFWEKAEIALDSALMLYLLSEAPKEEQTFEMLMFMLNSAQASEEDEQFQSPLDLLFQSLEDREPDHLAVKQYKVYKKAAGKTAKSILITAGVRLTAFIFPQYAAIMQEDEMDFGSLGERKRAIFCITPVNDGSMNYLVSMLFTQCFQELYLRADERYDGRLPVPVRVIQDEWANVPQPDSYPKVLATCRSYNIGIDIIVQNIQSIKARYRDEYQSIIGNCDTLLFLGGGNEPESLEFMSKLLGKETISIRTRGQTRGRSGSSSINYQLTGRELMTPDEIRRMPTREALLLIRGESPVRDRKYNIKKHPNYRYTQDGGAKPYIHNPPPAPDYALTDLPYVFRTLDDFRFLEDEYEQEKQEKMENRRRYLRERGAVLMRCYHRLRNRR